jgi:hypothetical protein
MKWPQLGEVHRRRNRMGAVTRQEALVEGVRTMKLAAAAACQRVVVWQRWRCMHQSCWAMSRSG